MLPNKLTLSDLKNEWATWRATRKTRRTPNNLRKKAVALLAEYTRSEIVIALGINYAMLKKWTQDYSHSLTNVMPTEQTENGRQPLLTNSQQSHVQVEQSFEETDQQNTDIDQNNDIESLDFLALPASSDEWSPISGGIPPNINLTITHYDISDWQLSVDGLMPTAHWQSLMRLLQTLVVPT